MRGAVAVLLLAANAAPAAAAVQLARPRALPRAVSPLPARVGRAVSALAKRVDQRAGGSGMSPPLALMPIVIPGVRALTDEALFPVVNAVMPAWLLLLLLPRWRYTKPIVTGTAIGFACLYALLVVPQLLAPGAGAAFSDMTSLAGLVKLFSDPALVFVGWIHYVVFDLLIARSIVEDANKIKVDSKGLLWRVPHLLVVPCLLSTMFAGPCGFLLYLALRAGCTFYRESGLIKRSGSDY